MIQSIIRRTRERYSINLSNSDSRDNEDLPVLSFLDSLDRNKNYTFLEVGSGECRFVKKIISKYPNLNITCVEINSDLATIAKELGCDVINDNILNICWNKVFDIVHCSHVIEHFNYPAISQLLDWLISSTKVGGSLIIRSPLMHAKFYYDLDHIRPYPPEAILNYLYNPQQQKKGQATIDVKTIWYRTEPKLLHMMSERNKFYHINKYRKIINNLIIYINQKRIKHWNKFRRPATSPTGYVMISSVIQK